MYAAQPGLARSACAGRDVDDRRRARPRPCAGSRHAQPHRRGEVDPQARFPARRRQLGDRTVVSSTVVPTALFTSTVRPPTARRWRTTSWAHAASSDRSAARNAASPPAPVIAATTASRRAPHRGRSRRRAALRRRTPRDRLPDPGGGAGHERDLPLETHGSGPYTRCRREHPAEARLSRWRTGTATAGRDSAAEHVGCSPLCPSSSGSPRWSASCCCAHRVTSGSRGPDIGLTSRIYERRSSRHAQGRARTPRRPTAFAARRCASGSTKDRTRTTPRRSTSRIHPPRRTSTRAMTSSCRTSRGRPRLPVPVRGPAAPAGAAVAGGHLRGGGGRARSATRSRRARRPRREHHRPADVRPARDPRRAQPGARRRLRRAPYAYLALYLANGFNTRTTVALLGTLGALRSPCCSKHLHVARANYRGSRRGGAPREAR